MKEKGVCVCVFKDSNYGLVFAFVFQICIYVYWICQMGWTGYAVKNRQERKSWDQTHNLLLFQLLS